jgi:RecA/RadA recombinase
LGYGFPGGYIVNFVGDKSAGKTFLAVEMLVANLRKFGKDFHPNHDDSESGCTFDTKALFGVDLYGNVEPRKSTTVEGMDANVGLWLGDLGKKGKGIYVIDSLDGLANGDLLERSEVREKLAEKGEEATNKGSYGMASPKFLSQEFFKVRTAQISDQDALLVIVSQVRENLAPGLYKPKFTRSGGKALDFYAHTCLWLSTVRKIVRKVDGEERVVGVVVEAECKKSKTPRPFRKCRFSLYFDYGMDNIGSNLDYLFDLRADDGSLLKVAEAVPWSGKAPTFKELTEWLKGEGVYDALKLAKREETGSGALGAEWTLDYIRKTPELQAKYEAAYGTTMTRDQLIAACEADPKMAEELTRRVREKWEGIEQSVATNRKPKYG